MDLSKHKACSTDDDDDDSVDGDDGQDISHQSRMIESLKKSNSTEKMAKMFRSLLDMMNMSSSEEIAQKLALMSQSPPLCSEMREYGYLPLLIQLLHQHSTEDHEINPAEFEKSANLRRNLVKALRNIINNTFKNKKEIRVLRLLEDLRSFVEILYIKCEQLSTDAVDHPCTQIAELLKISCEQEYKQIIEMLGGVYVFADVIQSDYRFHKDTADDNCFLLYRYSLMTLTNMTFNNSRIKSLLGSMRPFITVLVDLLKFSTNDDLIQSAADILRNLSWKTDYSSKQTLRDVKAVYYLTKTALITLKESTLKALLATLWNLTAHCTPNKSDFCKVEGAIEFIISTLSFTSNSPYSMSIVESGGGILRNISSYVATNEEYRDVLRKQNAIPILLEHLESSSLEIVSNACITLSNLSARSTKDQLIMLESNAIKKLRNLTNSKHKMIKVGASATLKNLLTSQAYSYFVSINDTSMTNSFTNTISSLQIRKMKAFKSEISNCLSDKSNFDNNLLDSTSPKMSYSFTRKVSRSNSHDSIGSTHSEPMQHKFCSDHKLLTMTTSQDSHFIPYNFNGQLVNSMYATLPANSRICDKDNTDISSDYDICCGDANCQISMSNSTTQNSFIDTELEVDPEPTDYSKRYKEHPIDDYTSPRSTSKPETGGCEDTVKVYQTEGTPLAFSLAPSLSDLRDLDIKNVYDDSNCNTKQLLKTTSPKTVSMDEISENFNSMNIKNSKDVSKMYKKPVLPPKPKFGSSSSAYNLKNLSSINEESFEQNEKSHNESTASTTMSIGNRSKFDATFSPKKLDQANMTCPNLKEQHCDESPILFTRSNSINSMMMNECNYYNNPWTNYMSKKDKSIDSLHSNIANNTQWINMKNQMTSSNMKFKPNSNEKKNSTFYYPSDSAVQYATEDTPAIFSHATSLSSLTVDDNEEDDLLNLTNTAKETENVATDSACDKAIEEGVALASGENYSNEKSANNVHSAQNNSFDDYDLLEACITSGINNSTKNSTPVAAKRYSKAKQETSVTQKAPSPNTCSEDRSNETEGKATNFNYFSSSISFTENAKTDNVIEPKQSAEASLHPSSSGFFTETTDKVSSDDDDEILQKCIASAMPMQKKKSYSKTSKMQRRINQSQQKESVIADQKKQFFVEDTPVHFSECHSSLSSLSFDSADEIDDNQLLEAAINFGMNSKIYPSKESPSGTASTHKSKHTVAMDSGQSIASNNCMVDSTDDDEKTYTVCTKSSRSANTKTLTSHSTTNMSDISTVSSVVDFESTNPPSLVDDHLMFSSTDSNFIKNGAGNSTNKFATNNDLIVKQAKDCNVNNKQELKCGSIELDKMSNSFDENSSSLLENVKPPSIIDHSSLMSQSTASITSEISDIAFDQIPIRKSSSDIVAAVASSCAKEINDLVQGCMNDNNTDTTSKSSSRNVSSSLSRGQHLTVSSEDIKSNPVDKTFAVEQTSRTLPRKNESSGRSTNTRTYNKSDRKTVITNGQMYESDLSDTDISEVLPLDEVNIALSNEDLTCNKSIPKILYNKPIDFPTQESSSRTSSLSSKTVTNKVFCSANNSKMITNGKAIGDVNECHDNDHRTKHKKSHKNNDIANEYTDKQLFFPIASNPIGQVTSQSLRRNHKYFNKKADFEDKDLLLTAQHKSIVTANHALFFQNKSNFKTASKYFDRHHIVADELNNLDVNDAPPNSYKSSNTNQSPAPNRKNKEKTSLLNNVKSKLTASLSSHNLGFASNSITSSSKNSSRKIEVKSKIASLWKRSKSTHDKLDHETYLPPVKNDMSRAEPSRRSFTKMDRYDSGESNNSGLLRSSTYEKLPVNDDEAHKLCARCGANWAENKCSCDGIDLITDFNDTANKFNTYHYGSLNKKRDKANGNFTFTTFVKSLGKSPSGSNNQTNAITNTTTTQTSSSNNNNNSDSSVPVTPSNDWNNNGPIMKSCSRSGKSGDKSIRSHSKKQTAITNDDSSTSSSSSQPRKTCLVTTV